MKSLEKYINVKLGLEVVDKDGEKVGPSYTTQIVQVSTIDNIDILAPTFDKYTIPLPIDTEIRIILKTGPTGNISLHGVVVARTDDVNGTLLKIKLNNQKNKNCPNTSVIKVDCDLKAEYLQINLKDNEDFSPSKVINISEYGVVLLVNEDIELHELLDIYIWLNNRKIINAVSDVTQKELLSNTDEYKYQLKLDFTEISTSAKDAIIKYIFGRQNESLRKN